jgi:dCTP deaminase
MILTGPEIVAQQAKGRIRIDPFRPDQINPNSYNFCLGPTITWYRNRTLDVKVKQDVETALIPESGVTLEPDRIYLGHTEETMGSDYYVPIIRGRSSTARIGLFIHVTADLIDIGSYNQWTLQLHAVQPVRLFAGMVIGQVTFWCVEGEVTLYKGKYQGSKGPMASEIYKDFLEPDR